MVMGIGMDEIHQMTCRQLGDSTQKASEIEIFGTNCTDSVQGETDAFTPNETEEEHPNYVKEARERLEEVEAEERKERALKRSNDAKYELENLEKKLKKQENLLELYQNDMENGTIDGLKHQIRKKQLAMTNEVGGAISGLLGVPCMFMGDPLIGLAVGGATFGLSHIIGLISRGVKYHKIKNPDNKIRLEYFANLPGTIVKQKRNISQTEQMIEECKSKIIA